MPKGKEFSQTFQEFDIPTIQTSILQVKFEKS